MSKFKDIRETENWVVVETTTSKLHHFNTFKEALESPIKGHVMSNQFYTYHYEQ